MNIALILSGGTGTRLESGVPKQYIEVGGKPILSYCIEKLSCHSYIDAIWIVASPQWQDQIREWLPMADKNRKWKGFSLPGQTRQLSIYNGMRDMRNFAGDGDGILVHDAARPFLTEQMISRCLEAMEGHDGVLPVLPMKDTVYASTDGMRITALLERSQVYAGQAPEVFRFGSYYGAVCALLPDRILEIHGSTEPAILAGMDIAMIPGDEGNFKITTKEDLERCVGILENRKKS